MTHRTAAIIVKKINIPEPLLADLHKNKKTHWREKKMVYLTADQMKTMKKWYFPIVLEMITVADKQDPLKQISKALSISLDEVKECVEVLNSKKLIEKNSEGHYSISWEKISTASIEKTTEEMKNIQQDFFRNMTDSIQKFDLSKRDHTTLFVKGNSSVIPEVKKRIQLFRRALANYIEKQSGGHSDQVFQLSIGFTSTLDS